jgi:hypothetical protein
MSPRSSLTGKCTDLARLGISLPGLVPGQDHAVGKRPGLHQGQARAGAVGDQIAGANEDLGSGAALVVGGEGVVSDRYAEGEQAAGRDLDKRST